MNKDKLMDRFYIDSTQMAVVRYASCPHCGVNVKDLAEEFINQHHPAEYCNRCEERIKRATGRMSIRFKK
jgi:predicted nucleic acid-binding Zn ribbon protein